MPFQVKTHFEKSEPAVRDTYDAIVKAARALGPVHEDPKKTSIHLVRETAFAGIAVRRESLILTLKADREIDSERVHKAEAVSANRWHVEIRVASPSEVDRELKGWLAAAYELGQRRQKTTPPGNKAPAKAKRRTRT